MTDNASDDVVIFSFRGSPIVGLAERVRGIGGIYSTNNKLIGGEQLVELAFYVSVPAALKLIGDIIKEVLRSRSVNAKLGDNTFENISDARLAEILSHLQKKSEGKKRT